MAENCPTCGQLIPDPVGRPESEAVRKAVDAVEAKKMSIMKAAAKFGVSRQAIYQARKRRERTTTSET